MFADDNYDEDKEADLTSMMLYQKYFLESMNVLI